MNLTKENIAELLNKLIDIQEFEYKPFGTVRFSDTYLITTKENHYVLRIAPPDSLLQIFYEFRMMRKEPDIHKMILENTTIPVPDIINYDFSRKIIDRDYLIMNLLPGKPLNEVSVNTNTMYKLLSDLGKYIRSLHNLQQPEGLYGYVYGNYCMEPANNWRDAFLTMYKKLIQDIVNLEVYNPETGNEAIALLEEYQSSFNHSPAPSLCHGDLWVENILVENNQISGIIDFDRSCWGDSEWDLAIAEYCGITRSPFWDGYGYQLDNKKGDAAIRRFFYLLYEHQKYIIISMSKRRNNPSGAKRYADQSLSAMQQLRETGEPRF